MWSLQTSRRAIIVAGCLGIAYVQLTISTASIEFVRSMGGTGLHVGILNSLPVSLLIVQFLAAVAANRMHYRRWTWVTLSILQRTVVVFAASLPLFWPAIDDSAAMWLFLLSMAVNQGLLHFCTPLWLSWMGDYLPHDDLGRFWGVRQRWMQWTAALSLISGAVLLETSGLGIRLGYPVLAGIAAFCGIADVLLFLKVEEPPVTPAANPQLSEVFLGPFRHPGFRSFIGFMCFWHLAAMIGAAFISLYLLQYVQMSLFLVLSLWACSWIGGALSASWMGHLADRFGNKPLLVLCVFFKSINMMALLTIPREPVVAFGILIPVFMVDAALNSGFAIATNGFLLKNSPAENRTMFIAAGTAYAGLVGGTTAVIAGAILAYLDDWSVVVLGRDFGSFHLMFSISLILRFVAAALVSRIHEPNVHDTIQVVTYLVGVTPLRVMRYPVGLYRSVFAKEARELRQTRQERPVAASAMDTTDK